MIQMTENSNNSLAAAQQSVLAKMKPAQILMSITGPVVAIMNFGGSVVAAIWLLILGEWGALGAGIAGILAGSFLMGIAMLPAMLFTPLLVMGGKSGNRALLYLGGFLSMAYTMVIASAWTAWCFHYFGKITHAAALIPACLWAYEVATTPWVFMASKEKDNPTTLMSAAFIQIVAIVLGVGFISFKLTFGTAFFVSAGILVVSALYLASIATDIAVLEG